MRKKSKEVKDKFLTKLNLSAINEEVNESSIQKSLDLELVNRKNVVQKSVSNQSEDFESDWESGEAEVEEDVFQDNLNDRGPG